METEVNAVSVEYTKGTAQQIFYNSLQSRTTQINIDSTYELEIKIFTDPYLGVMPVSFSFTLNYNYFYELNLWTRTLALSMPNQRYIQ